MLTNVFKDEVRGIDCVIESPTIAYTYSIWDGHVILKGQGDLHNHKYDEFATSIELTSTRNTNGAAPTYILRLYPTSDFFDVYSTDNSTIATIGAVLTILLTSALFFLYDLFVRRDLKSKGALLEAKRAFVRFVSHEVRTPLNSVIMGLTLMQEEIAQALGFNSVDDLLLNESAVAPAAARETRSSEIVRRTKSIDDWEVPGNNNSKALKRKKSGPLAESSSSALKQVFGLAKEIHENALRSVDVLNDLLNYDKIEVGNLKLELVIIPIQHLVEATANEFKQPTAQKKIIFNVDFTSINEQLQKQFQKTEGCSGPTKSIDLRTVGDDIRIAQVVRNLISNAIKFTPAGGSITVQAKWIQKSSGGNQQHCFVLKRGEELTVPTCGLLQISVLDSGAGMTPAQVETVFGDGVQFNANELQKGNGTGLGLHIAKGIMELHEGTLVASSAGLGLGTNFCMTMPLYHIPEEELKEFSSSLSHGIDEENLLDITSCTAAATIAEPEYEAGPLRVLIVDDAGMNRKLLARLLKNHGHICDEADDGDVGVEMMKISMAENELYDTVLLDHEMPRLSGPEAAKQMRAMGSDVFIVGVTGNLLPDDVALFKECGANAVLPKPFRLTALEDLWVEFGIRERLKMEAGNCKRWNDGENNTE